MVLIFNQIIQLSPCLFPPKENLLITVKRVTKCPVNKRDDKCGLFCSRCNSSSKGVLVEILIHLGHSILRAFNRSQLD